MGSVGSAELVELPMPVWWVVGRTQDRINSGIGHASTIPQGCDTTLVSDISFVGHGDDSRWFSASDPVAASAVCARVVGGYVAGVPELGVECVFDAGWGDLPRECALPQMSTHRIPGAQASRTRWRASSGLTTGFSVDQGKLIHWSVRFHT